MKKNYQTNDASAMGLAVPEAVTVAMAELAGDVQEGLLAMAVGTWLQVMAAMMHADVDAGCGPKGAQCPLRLPATGCDSVGITLVTDRLWDPLAAGGGRLVAPPR